MFEFKQNPQALCATPQAKISAGDPLACNSINTVQMAPKCRELTSTKADKVRTVCGFRDGMHVDEVLSPALRTGGNCSSPLASAAATTPSGAITVPGEPLSTFCAAEAGAIPHPCSREQTFCSMQSPRPSWQLGAFPLPPTWAPSTCGNTGPLYATSIQLCTTPLRDATPGSLFRQVVAFAPKVIIIACLRQGFPFAKQGNKMRRLRRRTREGVEVWFH
jgi:hypothetical protein